jgi:hypothetical protein
MADEAPHKQSDFAALKSAQHVAIFLSVNWRALRHCLYRMPPSERYRSFEIPKRGGGSRVIDAPTGTIKAMQVTLLRQIEQVYTPQERRFTLLHFIAASSQTRDVTSAADGY